MTQTAGIGHNRPPVIEEIKETLELLEVEASARLDGSPIASDAEAADVATLVNEARKLRKEADTERKAEAKPFDDGKKEVQKRWKPILDRADKIAEVGKRAQTEWLIEQERQREEAAKKARQKALEAELALQEARADAAGAPTDIAADYELSRANMEAMKAQKEAARLTDARTTAKGGTGKAMSLRTRKRAELESYRDAAAHYYKHRQAELSEWLLDQANKDIQANVQAIPGIRIVEEKVAV